MNNQEVIEAFYTAFAKHDAEGMAKLYADDVVFEDPGFGQLHGEEARNMWRMLIERGSPNLKVTFSNVIPSDKGGSADWEAQYVFGKKKRPVHNRIHAEMIIRDGKIVQHTDTFNVKKWAGMAMGFSGKLLGGTAFFRKKLQETARGGLKRWEARK